MAKEDLVVDQDFNGNSLLNMGEESISADAIITPPTISANENDYAPTGIQRASLMRISSTATFEITGIIAPDTARWKKLFVFNAGSSPITFTNESASSSPENRISMNANRSLPAKRGVFMLYDRTLSRWITLS